MNVRVSKKRQVHVIQCAGRLTLGDGEGQLASELTALLEQGGRRIVLNLSGLSIIDSAGIGEIVVCYKQAGDRGAIVKIALSPDGLVRHLFKASGLENAVEVHDDEASAVASFA